jgi:transcriptional regulator of arginine metabolism
MQFSDIIMHNITNLLFCQGTNMKITDQQLLDVLSQNNVRDQIELTGLVKNKGFTITQASLSRRLNKLGVNKVNGVYKHSIQYIKPISDTITAINKAPPNMILIKTLPGCADSFAYQLDLSKDQFPGMLGTIAGDDTLLVITSPDAIDSLLKAIKNMVSSV